MSGFVAIEGLDGVGKSTVVKALAALFSGHAMSTPGSVLHEVRPAVLQAFAENELAKALFYTASVSSQGRQARQLADSGNWVFMDRYWASTLAYAQARGVSADLATLSNALVQPDLTVLLVLDEAERQARLMARGATEEDMETLDPAFRQCVLTALQARASLVVDISGLAMEEAAARVVSAIYASR